MRPDPDRVRLAAEALARARADAWARGERPQGGNGGAGSPPTRGVAGMVGGFPGGRPPGVILPDDSPLPSAWSARVKRDDPQPFNVAVGGMLSARGWRSRASVAAVFGRWPEIVGPQLAAHAKPEAFSDGDLVVLADSPAWATQMRLLAPQILKRLGEELGAGTVRHVTVRAHGSRGRR